MPYKNKADQAAYGSSWYARNKEKAKARSYERAKRWRKELQLYILQDKEGKSCMDCGLHWHPRVMEYDHRPGTVKCFNVSDAPRLQVKLSRLVDEIAKCDLVCANCHRVRTFSEERMAS